MNPIADYSLLAQAAVEEFKKATLNGAGTPGNPLAKAGITISTGIVNYDLQRPAKNLIPVITPIRNRLPRVPGNGGTATNWIQVTGINTANLAGPVPEATRQAVNTTVATPKAASYATLGLEDYVSVQAELAAVNFEDIRATTAMRLLWATMIMEERNLVGQNYSITLAKPTTPTVTVVANGGLIPDATAGYDVRVVALTNMGRLAAGVTLAGVLGTVTATPADGSATFNYGSGSSIISDAQVTGAVSHSNVASLKAYTPVVNGAVAYAWYVGVTGSGNIYLQAITTINDLYLTVALKTGTQKASATAVASDASTNAYGWDGYLTTGFLGGTNNAYLKAFATGTEGIGTPLSAADPDGVIPELDTVNRYHWDNYRLGVDVWYVNSQEGRNISKKVLASNPTHINYAGGEGGLVGGEIIKYLLNPYTNQRQELIVHPDMPAGTMLGVTHVLPYPMSNVPNVAEMKLRRDYFQMEWPMRTLKYETGVYFDGVLAHYFRPRWPS